MSHSILRVERRKNAMNWHAIEGHVERKTEDYSNKDIDHNRTHLNYDLINNKWPYYFQRIRERIADGYNGKRKIRSDAVRLVDGLVTNDESIFDDKSPEQVKQFFDDSLEFLKEKYGEKNIVYAKVYLDEKTPHMHFGFVPLTKDG
nr:MAG TPA: Plasmid recombination enzyme [Caudoviricetes sp.]